MTLQEKTKNQFDKNTQQKIEAFKEDYLAAVPRYIDCGKVSALKVVRDGDKVAVS